MSTNICIPDPEKPSRHKTGLEFLAGAKRNVSIRKTLLAAETPDDHVTRMLSLGSYLQLYFGLGICVSVRSLATVKKCMAYNISGKARESENTITGVPSLQARMPDDLGVELT